MGHWYAIPVIFTLSLSKGSSHAEPCHVCAPRLPLSTPPRRRLGLAPPSVGDTPGHGVLSTTLGLSPR